MAEPPRQRRTGLAALAVALIVGGALAAGLLAVRMDARQPVLAAATDIAPGTLITQEHVREVSVASEGLRLIPADLASQILDGDTYARVQIRQDSLFDENVLTKEEPIGSDRAIVSVPLTPELTPREELRSGDLVKVFSVSRGDTGGPSIEISEALVLDVHAGGEDELGGGGGSLSLLVPRAAAADVVNASGSDSAGLALIQRGLGTNVELRTGR
ncbi:hypothetical protein GCM10007231_23930 [Nocardioides daphniae]|uniref:SAF domain-containing protein n=1 Tax=Nocardioides daphniae TaxID=402297 RepID=A0ABQ1QDI0_9ACTN|nr:hypothetical protein GCM10007231_23930 [Nocardioides daphniae]